jgi:tetratricopeptide (TPR) repeat protein
MGNSVPKADRTRWTAILASVIVTAALTASCGGKPAAAPVPVGAPKYPDFLYPSAQSTNDLAVPHQAAWDLLQSGDLRGAERGYSALLKEHPDFYPAEAGLGYVALARRDTQAAVSDFDKALAQNAQYAPALAGKGDALLSLGRTEAALQTFQAAVAADPSLTTLKSRVDVLKFRTVQQEIADARKAAASGNADAARRAYQSAIEDSPDSAFLYRELAAVDRRAGDTASALAHAEQAAKLDPTDPHALELEGDIHQARSEWIEAADAYAAAAAIEPSDALTATIEAMREKAALAAMPEEFRSIETSPGITRAQLAALIAERLPDLVKQPAASNPIVVTDARNNWALPWILTITRAGIMDAFPNHTFQPSAPVHRSDLAQAVSRLLAEIGGSKPRLAARWRDPHPTFPDLASTHLSYPAVARAVAAGVMAPLADGRFDLSGPVSGAEAIDAVSKLDALARK